MLNPATQTNNLEVTASQPFSHYPEPTAGQYHSIPQVQFPHLYQPPSL